MILVATTPGRAAADPNLCCRPDASLGGAVTADNPLGCDPGRNTGRRQPSWWPELRARLMDNLEYFPEGVDPAFLGAWIENESDGRHDLTSGLGEVGYFQLHPDEIIGMVGKDRADAVASEIQSSKLAALRWGGRLLKHYDEAIQPSGVARGTHLHNALLKLMHAGRPRGRRWLEHVTAVLGRPPETYGEFMSVANQLFTKKIPPRISSSIPKKLPSCSTYRLLERRDVFLLPGEGQQFPSGRQHRVGYPWYPMVVAARAANDVRVAAGFGAADLPFPGIEFGSPLTKPYAWVTSGWWQTRNRGGVIGTHQGLDLPAPEGEPVYSVADGVVHSVSTGEFAGLFVVIQHAAGWASRYMHLSQALVAKGQRVMRGMPIGRVGHSGTSRTAPHLHFDLLLDESRLPAYIAAFGRPTVGFGDRRALGVAVPAEPLIPVRGYESDVINDARRHGIPLYQIKPFRWDKAFAFGGILVLASMVGWNYYTRPTRRRRR